MWRKLQLGVGYKTLGRKDVTLVTHYPWYHPLRWIGYKFKDSNGVYRTAEGNISDGSFSEEDLNLYTRDIQHKLNSQES